MLNTKTETEIAVRLYDNKFYGTTYGKGLYRKALYNGSIDLQTPLVKYVIDLFIYDDWANQAKTDDQMKIIRKMQGDKELLFSWIYRYSKEAKTKTLVYGCCIMDCNDNSVAVLIDDDELGVEGNWMLVAKPCRQAVNGGKAATLLATNADLSVWQK
jgi:hypothetical protein